ncbi:beta-1,3-galactosyltransferase 1-like [Glandiceps talaboti]
MRGFTVVVLLSLANIVLWFLLYKKTNNALTMTKIEASLLDKGDQEISHNLKEEIPTFSYVNSTNTIGESTATSNITNYLTGRYINPHNYGYIINHEKACTGKPVFLLVLVTSHPKFRKARDAIRESWASVKEITGKRIVTKFLLGTTDDKHLQNTLLAENGVHGDILQEDFVDNYLNMTLKTIMGLKWASTYCFDASYICKTDTDMFVNYRGLVRFIDSKPRERYAVGYRFDSAKPERNSKRKWYTPFDIYQDPTYPPYLCGTGYVMSKDVAQSVYDVSLQTKYLSWEDVYVGICMQRIGIIPYPDKRFDTFAILYRRKIKCPLHSIFTIHGILPSKLRHIWAQYKREDNYRTCRDGHI